MKIQFLRIALGKKRDNIISCLRDIEFKKAEFIELCVDGVPGVERVVFFAWPDPPREPLRVGVDVVQVDDRVLDDAIRLVFDLPDAATTVTADEAMALWPGERSPLRSTSDVKHGWQRVESGQIRKEVYELAADGKPVFREVDTTLFCYRLLCPNCGRERYSKPNSIHQIDLCHVCTRNKRLRRRSIAQYKQRFRDGERKRSKAKKLD
jgi:hypothetical protein